MDQRFSVFLIEKYRLELQQGARTSYEDEISGNVHRPNKLMRLLGHIVTGITRSFKLLKKKDNVLMEPKRITNQSYIE